MDHPAAMDAFAAPDAEPAMPAVSETLPVRLLRAREAVMVRLRPILRARNITEQQWRVLRTIRDLNETEITVLAARVFLLPPSLSRIVKDLEARGLINRRTSENDLRRAIVALTPAGEAVISDAQPELAGAVYAMRAQFGAERMDQLYSLLSELEAILGPGEPAGEG
jgi:homoprotocatechuate degradation regulator HpaR